MPDEEPRLDRSGAQADELSGGLGAGFAIYPSPNGDPLYTLVTLVDDALMKITHVLRGEDIMPSTPRQIAPDQALMRIPAEFLADQVPQFAPLAKCSWRGNNKLSKRDPQSNPCSCTAIAVFYRRGC